jgi:hypothetical protein
MIASVCAVWAATSIPFARGSTLAPIDSWKELIMKRLIAAGVSILAVAAGVGWKLASHPESATTLEDVSLIQHSEHSQPGPTEALAGIRIRLSPSDFDDAMSVKASEVPKIAVAAAK